MRKFFQILWFSFCRLVTRLLYYRTEVLGAENVPQSGPVLLCINHINSLVDGVIVQAALSRTIRPVARKRLFDLPFTGHILNWIKAVPVYSRAYGDTQSNNDLKELYQLINDGELIVIFPEGHSHDEPRLFPIKKGAARMALGALNKLGQAPKVIPVGLTYTHQKQFRRSVLVQFGEPVDINDLPEGEDVQVSVLTERIQSSMQNLVVEAGTWEELDFTMRVAAFYHLREGKARRLSSQFRTMKTLLDHQYRLKARFPALMEQLERDMTEFDVLCRRYGLSDYHLDIHYTLPRVSRFVFTALAFTLIVVPLGIWGYLNMFLPRLGVKIGMKRANISSDQIDTARVLGSLFMTTIFWTTQSYLVFRWYGGDAAFAYAFSLGPAACIALLARERRKELVKHAKVFVLFLRKRELKAYMVAKRKRIEATLAKLVRLSKLPIENYD